MFHTDIGPVDIRRMKCSKKVTGNQQLRADPQCMGVSRAIGFNVTFPDGNRFIDLFYSCINETIGSVLYTNHDLNGNEILRKLYN